MRTRINTEVYRSSPSLNRKAPFPGFLYEEIFSMNTCVKALAEGHPGCFYHFYLDRGREVRLSFRRTKGEKNIRIVGFSRPRHNPAEGAHTGKASDGSARQDQGHATDAGSRWIIGDQVEEGVEKFK